MYDFKYQYLYQSGSTQDSRYQHKTILTAVFSFDQEVPPNRRAEVKKRCSLRDFSRPCCIDGGQLDSFMRETLHYQPSNRGLSRGELYFSHRGIIRITPHLWGLGFNLRSEMGGQIPLEQMIISLNAINKFVLTGKISPRIEEKLQAQPA
jgi:hypothetical protein